MSEADKKARTTSGQSEAGQPDGGDRGATIKPFPDFIAASPSPGSSVGMSGPAAQGPVSQGPIPQSHISQASGTTPSSGGGGADQFKGGPKGGSGGGQALPPTPRAKSPPPPRARGGGWAFMFALVSLTAAGVSLSGPSLRPIAAEKLREQFGDQEWIGIVTGTADTRPPSVIQLDLAAFDRRLDALASTLTTANPGAPVDGETLARFADAAGATREIATLDAALTASRAEDSERDATLSRAIGVMETRLAELDQRAGAVETTSNGLTESLQEFETRSAKALELAEGADTASKELATTLGGIMPRLDQAEAGLTALTGQLEGLSAGLADRVTAALAPFGARLDGLDAKTAEIAAGIGAALEPLKAQLAALDEGTKASLSEAAIALTALKDEMTSARSGIAVLDEKIAALEVVSAAREGALGAVSERLTANSAASAALAERVGTVEDAVKRQAGVTGAALLGLSNRVRIAVDEGETFAPELAVIKTLAADDPRYVQPLQVLTSMAGRGAPSLSILRREFNVVARKVIEVEEAAQPSWYDRQWSNVTYYLGWSAAAPASDPLTPDPEPARAVLAQAAAAINAGRFDEALAAMVTLRGPGAEHATQWVGAARERVAADKAARVLSALALSQIHQ